MRILLVVHGFPPAAGGGTEVYTRDLARALAAMPDAEVGVLARESDPARPDLALRRAAPGAVRLFVINNTFQSCGTFAESYEHPGLLAVAAAVLDEFQPDVVHLQHLTCLSTRLPAEIARRRIPTVLTLNDYWLLCHRGQLFDLDGQRCAGPFDGGCGRCIPPAALPGRAAYSAGRFVRRMPIPGAAAAVRMAEAALDRGGASERTRAASTGRLAHMQAAVADIDRILAPSETMAARFRRFGLPAGKMIRCDQGIALDAFKGLRRTASPQLRLVCAGGLIPSKAPHLLLDAVALLPPGSVVVDLLGPAGAYHGRHDYAESLTSRLRHPAIRRLGPVPHERMAATLYDADVVVVPSVWIENAPFIIREAFAAGAPVVASDLGGMAEMVRDGVNGLLFPPGDVEALAGRLRRLLEEPELLPGLRAGITPPLSIEDDAASLRELYETLVAGRPAVARAVAAPAVPSSVAAVVLNYRTPDQTWLAVRSLQTAFTPPGRIIVVDNGSTEASLPPLRNLLPGVEIIASAVNLGFPGGCNAGIRAALEGRADFILLVNSDAVLAPDAIGLLLGRMRSDPSVGIAAPRLLSREEPGWIASSGISYSRQTGRMRQLGAGQRSSAAPPAGGAEAVSGCVMLVRRDVFEQVGLLDEAYFFSFEDIDFCLRAADRGLQSRCVSEAIAYHEGGRSIGRRSPRRVYYATRNHLRLQARVGPAWLRPLHAALVVALNAAYVIFTPEAPLVSGLAAVARGTWHHLLGRYGEDRSGGLTRAAARRS